MIGLNGGTGLKGLVATPAFASRDQLLQVNNFPPE